MSDSKPPLAVVETAYETNFRDIPAMLRRLAEEIDAGEHGAVAAVACVIDGDELEVFSWGARASLEETAVLLQAGALWIVCRVHPTKY